MVEGQEHIALNNLTKGKFETWLSTMNLENQLSSQSDHTKTWNAV